MAKYEVAKGYVKNNKGFFQPGQIIELSNKAADRLLEAGIVINPVEAEEVIEDAPADDVDE